MLIASYAKINLFLEVQGKLPNNYHQINTVFCSIDLCDRIKFTLTKKPSVKLLSNLQELNGDTNLIYRVAQYLLDNYRPKYGIDIYLEKGIPLAAGLGGGSSNAAVTLMTLNKLWDLSMPISELEEIASVFGSDIVYFLHGGTAQGQNRGEIISPLSDIPETNILLAKPDFGISSGEAYALCHVPDQPLQWLPDKAWHSSFNRLEAGVCAKYPKIQETLDTFRHYNACHAMMSGSGSTCFGIFEDDADRMRCKQYFAASGYWTQDVKTLAKEEYKRCFQNLS